MAKKLTLDYLVHRGSTVPVALPATLQDGTEVEAVVDGFVAELVPDGGAAHGTITLRFAPGDPDAAALLQDGAKVTVTIA